MNDMSNFDKKCSNEIFLPSVNSLSNIYKMDNIFDGLSIKYIDESSSSDSSDDVVSENISLNFKESPFNFNDEASSNNGSDIVSRNSIELSLVYSDTSSDCTRPDNIIVLETSLTQSQTDSDFSTHRESSESAMRSPSASSTTSTIVSQAISDSGAFREENQCVAGFVKTRRRIFDSYVHVVVNYPGSVMLLTALVCTALTIAGFVHQGVPDIKDPQKGMESRGDNLILDILLQKRLREAGRTLTPMKSESEKDIEIYCLVKDAACPVISDILKTHGVKFFQTFRQGVILRPKPGVSVWNVGVFREYCQITNQLSEYVTGLLRPNNSEKIGKLWNKSEEAAKMFIRLSDNKPVPVTSLLSFAVGKCFSDRIPDCASISKATVGAVRSKIERCRDVEEKYFWLKENCTFFHDNYPRECFTPDSNLLLTYFLPKNHTTIDLLPIKLPILPYKYTHEITKVSYALYQDLTSFITTITQNLELLDLAGIELGTREEEFILAMRSDLIYVMTALGIVAISIAIYTRSLFYTFVIVISFVFALGISYFIYGVVIGIKFFPFINLLTLVILVGVGADDAFILEHCWTDTERKLEKTSKSSSNRDVSAIKDVASRALSHAISSMFVTSVTTSAALLANGINDVVVIKCFGVFAGLVIFITFLLVITWLTSSWIFYKKYVEKGYYSLIPMRCYKMEVQCWGRIEMVAARVFQIHLPWLIFKLRYILVLLLTILSVVAGFALCYDPTIQLPNHLVARLFKDTDRPDSHYYLFLHNSFPYAVQQSNGMQFYWGLDRGNLKDLAKIDPDDIGGPLMFTPGLNITSRQFLENVSKVADEFLSLPFVQNKPESNWVKEYLKWARKDLVPQCYDYLNFQCAQAFFHAHKSRDSLMPHQIYHLSNASIRAIELNFDLTFEPSLNFSHLEELFRSVQMFQLNVKNQFGIPNPAIMSSPDYEALWYNLLTGLIHGSRISVTISLIIAFFSVLITTWHLVSTFLSILVITQTILTVAGCLAWLRWQLNVVEATLIILTVGLCFDFTLHYAVAFQFTWRPNLHEQLQATLGYVGPPVAMAAATSAVAGICMLNSATLPFFQIGVFMVLVIAISWIYATFCFLPMIVVAYEIRRKIADWYGIFRKTSKSKEIERKVKKRKINNKRNGNVELTNNKKRSNDIKTLRL